LIYPYEQNILSLISPITPKWDHGSKLTEILILFTKYGKLEAFIPDGNGKLKKENGEEQPHLLKINKLFNPL
jgi:hypothetical protein